MCQMLKQYLNMLENMLIWFLEFIKRSKPLHIKWIKTRLCQLIWMCSKVSKTKSIAHQHPWNLLIKGWCYNLKLLCISVVIEAISLKLHALPVWGHVVSGFGTCKCRWRPLWEMFSVWVAIVEEIWLFCLSRPTIH